MGRSGLPARSPTQLWRIVISGRWPRRQSEAMPSWPAHDGGNNAFHFGGSSTGAGGGHGRTNTSSAHRRQRGYIPNRGGRGRGGCGGRATRSHVPPQAPAGYDNNVDEEGEWDQEMEDLGSSGGPPDEGNGLLTEEGNDDDGDNTSSSDDEIISMCRKNLEMTTSFVAQIVPILSMYSDKYFVKLPRRVAGESGLQWVQRTLARDNSCYKMFRVERALFNRLHNILVESYGLSTSSKMSTVEALAMFLWIVGAPQSVRQAEDHFVRSMETVSRTFDTVLTCILRLAPDIIKPKDPSFSEVHRNLESPEFWPHFNNCIGAIDGTHVKVVVPKSKRIQYLNRHNDTSQNVLAVCDFDMRFTFVLSGWPDSVHDMRVFKDAITTHQQKFPHPPPGKYYVVDAGYPNRPGYLSPYRCTRYHVEQWHNGPAPQGMKETFNHSHSRVRNVIERSFGVLKMKWRMLLDMPKFSEKKKTNSNNCCLHGSS